MKKSLYLFLVLFAGLGMISPVFALTVSPVKIDITGDPGNVVHGNIELFNEEDFTKTFYSSFENFETNGESGAPNFIGAKDGLATWLKTDEKVELKPKERKNINFSINIPVGTEPGGYFAAIFWGSQPVSKEGSGQVSIGGKLGILVLLRVSGEVKEGGGLINFSAIPDGKFFDVSPGGFYYRFNNTGGDKVIPQGKVAVKNMFGGMVFEAKVNPKEGSVLPGSTRKFEVTWSANNSKLSSNLGFFDKVWMELKDFHLGWYKAELDLFWGEKNKTAAAEFSFFIIPWHLLVIVFLILFIVLFLGGKGLRSYNRFIIAQARRGR